MAKVVEMSGVRYCYPDTKEPALEVGQFSLDKGDFCCVLGANGAGKSSFCRAIAGLAPHFYRGEFQGSITVCGLDTKTTTIAELAGVVGYVMDDPFDQLTRATYSVREEIAFGLQNIGMPATAIFERVEQVLTELNIASLADRLPTALSGGEQQRVAIASILARQPEVLVMDEATSQLDPRGCEGVFRMARQFKDMGKTVIMVEPKLDQVLAYANKLIVLDQGRQVAEGSPKDLLSAGVFQQFALGLPSYPDLALRLRAQNQYSGELPIRLDEAKAMVTEVLTAHD